jgi:hypothetical protein
MLTFAAGDVAHARLSSPERFDAASPLVSPGRIDSLPECTGDRTVAEQEGGN